MFGSVAIPFFLFAFVASASAAETGGGERQARTKRQDIEEVVVTANRRVQNVQDIASGIRVLNGDALALDGVAGLEDYVFKIPGVDLADSGMEKKIAIRGIGNIASNPQGAGGSSSPVGFYLNDTPVQGNGVLPDLALYDLERIEVLKGPQGTLYGEGAQGGAIRMLLAKADPSGFAVKGEAGIGKTRFGGGWNRSQSAALNLPLFDSWATRLVVSRRETQGFIDFPGRGTRDENDATNEMARLHLDGEVWEGFGLSAMVLHQDQRLDQFPQVQKEEGDLQNRNLEDQFSDTVLTLAGLTLDYDLSFAQLTSSTSWFRNDRQALSRLPFLGAIVFVTTSPLTGGGIEETPGADREWTDMDTRQSSIAQEFRLVSSQDYWLEWVAGIFYRARENDFNYLGDNDGSDEPSPVGPGVYEFTGTESFEQIAVFGEATVSLPWNLKLTGGVRVFHETAELVGQGWARGPLFPLFAIGAGSTEATYGELSFDITTTEVAPKVSLSWFVDDFRMIYALAANGVRSGGTNPNAFVSDITPLFSPDSLWTYEIGTKTQWFDGRLTANLSIFRNEWEDLQVLTTEVANVGPAPIALAVVLNVGSAYSRGAELELQALPMRGLSFDFNISRLDGEITKGDPAGTVADGTPLPQISELSYSAAVRYELLDTSVFGLTPFLGVDTQRTGDRTMSPPGTLAAPSTEGFKLYGATFGLTNESVDLTVGVRNLTDERPEIGANLLELDTLTIGTPRTWTFRVAYRWP